MLMEIASHKIIFQNRPAIMTLGRDVTNQVKAEAALKLSEEKFHSLVDYAADAIFMLTQDGIVFDVNKIALELFQVQRENIIGKRILDIIYADEANAENSVWDLLKINKYFSEERKWVRQNGLLVDLEIRAKMLPDGTGAITIIRDITQRKKFEEQLALVASIVNSSDDAIISKTLDGIITSWNKGAERVLGYPASTVIGNSINLFIPPNLFSEETEINKSILNGVAIEHFETVRLRKDGVLINVSLTISPIKDEFDHVIGASIIMRDITEKKKMELENDKIMSELLQRNRDLEQFSYIISHNLRLPVANIMGISDYILNAEVNDSEEIEQLNSGLSKSVHALDGVIKDLNFILQTKREISEKNTLVKFSQLCDDIRLSIANLIQSEGVVIRTNFEEVDEMLTLKSYLYSIFYNLISNSIKYKQPHIAPIIEIRSALIGTKIEIVFKDNGLGIDIEKRKEQIFGLYKRFHSHTEGKGMGLYMVKTQVETLGGKISIKSEVNQGTEFIIEFDINIHRSA
jgi:PAS domain S-box-containing protein